MEPEVDVEGGGYRVTVQGRHVELTDAIRTYALEKVSKIERFSHRLIDVAIHLEVERSGEHKAIVIMRFDHLKIKVEGSSNDLYQAIDRAVAKLQAQVYKYKTKILDHRKQRPPDVDMEVNVVRPFRSAAEELNEINAEIASENERREWEKYQLHQVVKKEKKPLKTLRTEEAILKMELSGDAFLVYRSEEDQKIKVIYRREDDDYGIIETV